MTESLPAPLTAPDCDLRHFRDLPLDIHRLRDSDLITHEDPEAVVAALLLWGAAWHQVPAASLPDDDRILARYAGYGRALDAWARVRPGALRGFVRCADGRLYHRTLAEKANESWRKHLEYSWNKAKDRHRKAMRDLPEAERTEFPAFDDWLAGRPPPRPEPKRQGDLPLEASGFPAEQNLARLTRASEAGARTGAKTVPKANSGGTEDEFQRKGGEVPAETALKGKEKKGILSTQHDSSHKQPARVEQPGGESGEDKPPGGQDLGRLANPDLKQLFDATCDAAGFRPVSPSRIDSTYRIVEEWKERGIDFEEIVLPAIRAVVADLKEPVRGLWRFRDRVNHEAAKAKARKANGQASSPPRVPLLEPQGEDPALRPLRAMLLERLGPQIYSLLLNAVKFESTEHGDKHPLLVHGMQHNVEIVVHGRNAPAIRAAAREFGFTELWKGGDISQQHT